MHTKFGLRLQQHDQAGILYRLIMRFEEAEISILGDKLTPSTFDIKDLAEVLTSIDDLLVNATPNSTTEITIGLNSISEGSVKLGFATAVVGLLTATLPRIADTIAAEETSTLPYKTRRSLVALREVAKRKNVAVSFPGSDGGAVILNKDTSVEIANPVRGQTEQTVRVLRAGGKSPRGMFEAPQGNTIYVNLTEDQAIRCGKLLYEQVKLHGTGTWDPETHALISFNPDEISKPIRSTQDQAVRRLGDVLKQLDPNMLPDIRREGVMV
jgi:hypothetical protein